MPKLQPFHTKGPRVSAEPPRRLSPMGELPLQHEWVALVPASADTPQRDPTIRPSGPASSPAPEIT